MSHKPFWVPLCWRPYRFEKFISGMYPKLGREPITSSVVGECVGHSATVNLQIVACDVIHLCKLFQPGYDVNRGRLDSLDISKLSCQLSCDSRCRRLEHFTIQGCFGCVVFKNRFGHTSRHLNQVRLNIQKYNCILHCSRIKYTI